MKIAMRLMLAATAILLSGCGSGSTDSDGGSTAPVAKAHEKKRDQTSGKTATYTGNRSDYTITKTATGHTVKNNATGAVDTLTDVQSIRFADVTVNLVIADKAGTISADDLRRLTELYIAFFNRVPEADGLSYWIDQRKSGQTLNQIAESFYSAGVQYPALTGYSSVMSNDEFVRVIYKNVLGRSGATSPPDADVQYWSGELASGRVTKGTLISTMLASAYTFKNDATWGWVPALLENKYTAGYYHAVQQGLGYNTDADSISRTMTIAAAVTATDANAAIQLIDVVTGTTAIAPPGNLSALAVGAQINLNWSVSITAGVVKYRIFRNGETTPLAESTGTSYSDASVQPSTAYHYQVKAVDAAGNVSAASNMASVTTGQAVVDTTAPTVPADLGAVATSITQVQLSWTASTDNVGVAKYQIFRNGEISALGEATATHFTDTSASPGANYTYRVRAVDAQSNVSGLSSAVSVTMPGTVDTAAPSVPLALSASASSTTEVSLSWTASTDNVGVKKYQLFRNGGATALAESSGTIYTDTSVNANSNYSYQVRAVDAANNASGLSVAATVTTPASNDTTPPSIPGSLAAVAAGVGKINLSWAASTDNTSVKKYQVFRNGSITALAEPIGTSYADTSVIANTAYSYQVRAVDAAGNASGLSSPATATAASATDTVAPSAPGSLAAIAAGAGKINLSWIASTDNVGVVKYRVFRNGSSTALAEPVGTTYTDTSVSAGTAYTYQVQAFDAASNASALSNSATATALLAADTSAPTKPVGLTASAVSAKQVNLSWLASTDNVGVTKYQVFRDGSTTALAEPVGTTYTDLSTAGNTTYSYQVRAVDAANNASELSSAVIVKTSTVSGEAMPTGDLSGWHLVFSDDFLTSVPTGSFPTAVSSRWGAYPDGWKDTSKNGTYMPSKVVSVHDGVMDLHLRTENGVRMAAAPYPKLPQKTNASQRYGRYAIRFKSDAIACYKTAWLLWPDSEIWPRDGEIDFPEGDLNGAISAFMHRQDAATGNDQAAFPTTTKYTDWHTAVIEWSPGLTTFILDGVVIGSTTSRVPDTPMHWVIQTETSLGCIPANTTSGHVLIDWVAVYSRVAP